MLPLQLTALLITNGIIGTLWNCCKIGLKSESYEKIKIFESDYVLSNRNGNFRKVGFKNTPIQGLLHDNSKLIKIYKFALKYTYFL